MELIYPKPGARIYIPVEIDGSLGQTVFKATHRQQGASIFWHLDNQFVGTTTDFHQMPLRPSPGRHTLTIVDDDGEQIQLPFEILGGEKKHQ